MFWRSKLNIALVVLPIFLLAPLFYAINRRPKPLLGANGPAPLPQRATALAYGPNDTIYSASGNSLQSYRFDEKSWHRAEWIRYFNGFESGKIQDTPTQRLNFSRDGKTLFAAGQFTSRTETIQAFDAKSLKLLYCFGLPLNGVYDISPDGKWAAFRRVGSLVLLDLSAPPLRHKQGEKQLLPNQPELPPNYRDYPSQHYVIGSNPQDLQFSPDSKTLAVAYDHQIDLFTINGDLINRTSKAIFGQMNELSSAVEPSYSYDVGSPRRVEWSPDGTKLVVYAAKSLTVLDSKLSEIASTPFFGQSNASADII